MILVTGTTGQVGHVAAQRLVAAGASVRGLVRDPARARAVGLEDVDLVIGAFEDEAAVARAMAGVELLLLAGRENPDDVAHAEQVIAAAERAGVRHVVKLSAIGAATDSPIELLRHHGLVERRLAASRLPWTGVRPHFFLQNLLRETAAVRNEGRLRAPMGEARVPRVDTRDVGEALAAILLAPGAHAGATYTLTGQAGRTYDEVAQALAEALGRPVTYEPALPADRERELRAADMPDWRAYDLAHIAGSYAAADWAPTSDLAALLGRPPRSLEDFVHDHRAAFTAGTRA